MKSPEIVLWCVDAQKDFMLPGGKLYVPGAEKLLPNIRRLVDVAREGRAFLVSHGCFHTPDDPEFAQFPSHCVKSTEGSEFVAEAVTDDHHRVPNSPEASIPQNPRGKKQIIFEKQTLDIFETHHAEKVLKHLDPNAEIFVFGVVTEYCVRLAAKGLLDRGHKVTIIEDAIETLDPEIGRKTLSELKALGAKFATTDQALARLNHSNHHQ